MIGSLLQSEIGGLMYASSSSIALYTVSAVVLCLVFAFLAVTAYFHYIHWKYSHIPQPKRPRLVYYSTVHCTSYHHYNNIIIFIIIS